MNASEASLEALTEVPRVQLAPRHHMVRLAPDEACRLKAIVEEHGTGTAMLNGVAQRRDQLRLPLQPQQVVTQVVAEWAGVVDRVRKQIVHARTRRLARDYVQRLAREIRMPLHERIQPFDIPWTDRARVQCVQLLDLRRREVFERQRDADVERRFVGTVDEELRLSRCRQDDVEPLPLAPYGMGAKAVPAPEHGEEVPRER